jgi:catechol 2,3-dioxygenase-like lactoylglutathione lyase family enzyme
MKAKLTYTGIWVSDLEKSVSFYTRVLGMSERGRNRLDVAKGIVVDLVSEGSRIPSS